MNGTSVSNGTRLLPISISQQSFRNFPESLGKWKTPQDSISHLEEVDNISIIINGLNPGVSVVCVV